MTVRAAMLVGSAGRGDADFYSDLDLLLYVIETFIVGGVWEGDVAFYIRPGRALVVAELLMGTDGGLRFCPPPALQDRAAFEASLQTLLRWPIDHVLVSHGEPVIGDGGRQINDALRAFAETW